jgi:hypothetical protein
MIVALIVIGSGLPVELRDMPAYRVQDYAVTTLKFPNLEGPVRYVREHWREGDVIITSQPHHANHFLHRDGRPDWNADYWPAMSLVTPATLDNHRTVPFDRKDGTTVLPSYANTEELFARHPRVWYIVQPGMEAHNGPIMSALFRQHMDVVYQDWQTLVLFRGEAHRPAAIRARDEKDLAGAAANFMP